MAVEAGIRPWRPNVAVEAKINRPSIKTKPCPLDRNRSLHQSQDERADLKLHGMNIIITSIERPFYLWASKSTP